MKEPERAELDLAASQIAQQLSECHHAVMAVFKFAETHPKPEVQLDAMKAATRMMQAGASAASALKRLREKENHHTFTYIREGIPPTPKKSKTNGHAEALAEHRA